MSDPRATQAVYDATAENWTTICRCGTSEVAVDPEAVDGAYAVHPTISGGRAKGPGYTITHRPSGFALWHVRAFDRAVAVARWAAENLALPESLQAVEAWKAELTPLQRTSLVEQLSAIAPREWVAA